MSSYCNILVTFLALSVWLPIASAKDTKVTITVEESRPVGAEAAGTPFVGKRAAVDVAILLDTSNSMDGLISQAKNQLWTIVQQFAKAKKNGQTPLLRVALFEYGNTGLPASEGYIRQVVGLTDDLDKISEALFALRTNGGDEYCGQVIQEAIRRLDWSKEPGGYKAIFIAGNEPFTQGSVDYRESCRRAIEAGIVVNTVHCGNNQSGIDGKWQHGAQLAEGKFFNIDQDRAVVHIDCPQDKLIIELNAELNKTYLWYGSRADRDKWARNQLLQDSNASLESEGVAASRSITKAGKAYRNVNRDLVDTLQEDKEILQKVEAKDLPEPLRQLSLEKRKEYVEALASKRHALQKKINALAAQREVYLKKERRRLANPEEQATLGDALVATIQQQLHESGFDIGSQE